MLILGGALAVRTAQTHAGPRHCSRSIFPNWRSESGSGRGNDDADTRAATKPPSDVSKAPASFARRASRNTPNGLCRLIAGSVVDHWADTLARQPRTSLPDDWATSYCTDMGQAMRADCAKKTIRLQHATGTA